MARVRRRTGGRAHHAAVASGRRVHQPRRLGTWRGQGNADTSHAHCTHTARTPHRTPHAALALGLGHVPYTRHAHAMRLPRYDPSVGKAPLPQLYTALKEATAPAALLPFRSSFRAACFPRQALLPKLAGELAEQGTGGAARRGVLRILVYRYPLPARGAWRVVSSSHAVTGK